MRWVGTPCKTTDGNCGDCGDSCGGSVISGPRFGPRGANSGGFFHSDFSWDIAARETASYMPASSCLHSRIRSRGAYSAPFRLMAPSLGHLAAANPPVSMNLSASRPLSSRSSPSVLSHPSAQHAAANPSASRPLPSVPSPSVLRRPILPSSPLVSRRISSPASPPRSSFPSSRPRPYLYFRSTCIQYRTLCTLSPSLNTSQCRWTGTGFRTILSGPTDPYSLLTAARGFLIPFRLPRGGQILVSPSRLI